MTSDLLSFIVVLFFVFMDNQEWTFRNLDDFQRRLSGTERKLCRRSGTCGTASQNLVRNAALKSEDLDDKKKCGMICEGC